MKKKEKKEKFDVKGWEDKNREDILTYGVNGFADTNDYFHAILVKAKYKYGDRPDLINDPYENHKITWAYLVEKYNKEYPDKKISKSTLSLYLNRQRKPPYDVIRNFQALAGLTLNDNLFEDYDDKDTALQEFLAEGKSALNNLSDYDISNSPSLNNMPELFADFLDSLIEKDKKKLKRVLIKVSKNIPPIVDEINCDWIVLGDTTKIEKMHLYMDCILPLHDTPRIYRAIIPKLFIFLCGGVWNELSEEEQRNFRNLWRLLNTYDAARRKGTL